MAGGISPDAVSCTADAIGWIPGGGAWAGALKGVDDITKSFIKGGSGALGFITSSFGTAYGTGSIIRAWQAVGK